MSMDTTETVASFAGADGLEYEIDHLGISSPNQWGDFTIYRGGTQIAKFTLQEALLKPKYRPAALPVTTDELVTLAKAALIEAGITS